MPWASVYLCEQAALLVTDPHHSSLDKHLEPHLIELVDANDVRGEAGNEVGVDEGAVLPFLKRPQFPRREIHRVEVY
jgi:hypothetical protein